jgi:hypothetical protein
MVANVKKVLLNCKLITGFCPLDIFVDSGKHENAAPDCVK